MNFKSLEYFLAIAQAGSLSRAARMLNIAQPALSRVVAGLEGELGQKLLLRHARGVSLTESGQLLRERADQIRSDLARLRDDLHARSSEPQGSISVGLPPSFASAFAIAATRRLLQIAPDVEIRFREGPTQDLLAALTANELDATVATLGSHSRHFETTLIGQDHMGLVCPIGTKIGKRGVSIKALADKPLVLMSNTRFMMERIERAALQANVVLRYKLETNSLLAVRLAAAGLAHTIMPMCVMRSEEFRGRVVAAPIRELPIEWGFCVTRTKSMSAALTAFRRSITDAWAQHES